MNDRRIPPKRKHRFVVDVTFTKSFDNYDAHWLLNDAINYILDTKPKLEFGGMRGRINKLVLKDFDRVIAMSKDS